jgi:hypothetical protein
LSSCWIVLQRLPCLAVSSVFAFTWLLAMGGSEGTSHY